MKRREFLSAPAFLPGVLQAQAVEGVTSIFDGKSLTGWNIQDGPESAFYVDQGSIIGSPASMFPAWLRSEKQYENFDFRCEFFVKGWTDGGVYLHAPEHGRNTWAGMQVKIFHDRDVPPRSNSMGAIFPLIAPSKVNVKNNGEWNTLRILMDWPALRVWVNGEVVQDLDVETFPELKYRLRRGYLGLSTLGYPLRFRNLGIRQLPGKEKWEHLFETDDDLSKWRQHSDKSKFVAYNGVLRSDGSDNLVTREKYRDFMMQLYVRGAKHHNGGVLFRTNGNGSSERHYEIQIHNVEDSHYQTGSLYHFKRAIYPRIEDEKWYLMQIVVKARYCLVRINGENVLEYDDLQDLGDGYVELQAHQPGVWLEHKHVWIRRL